MKEKLKNMFNFLKKPNLTFTLICYGLFFVATTLTIVCLSFNTSTALMSVLYGFMGITFFYCCYLFIMFDFKKIKNWCKLQKEKISKKNKFLNKLFNDIYFRTMLATTFSLFLGILFVAYNAFAGIYYHSVWNGSISVYYAFLVVVRIMFLINEAKFKNFNNNLKEQKRAKLLKNVGIMLLFVNLALVAPVTLLALSKKDVNLPMWVAIANACYAFYKITICIISFVKTRHNSMLSVRCIKNLNLTSALVTLLSLENTMIITFSENGIESSMHIMMILSAFVVMLVNIWIAISSIVKGKNKMLNQSENPLNKDN